MQSHKPIAYFNELDRAYRAPANTALFILQSLIYRFGVTLEELNTDIRARFGHDFH